MVLLLLLTLMLPMLLMMLMLMLPVLLIMMMLMLTAITAGATLVRVTDNEALLHGGADPASAQIFSDAWILNLQLATWTQLEATDLVARHALQGVALPNGSFLFIGGSSKDGPTWQPQVLQRSGAACTVTDVTTARCNSSMHFPQAFAAHFSLDSLMDVPARELFAAAVVPAADEGGHELVILHGGHCKDALLQTVTALDVHTLEVVYTEDAPEARVAHAGVWVGGCSMMMYGGTNMLHPPAHDDCLLFDASSRRW
jgi:hypothetical protein